MEAETLNQLAEKLIKLYQEGPKGSIGQPIGFSIDEENVKPIIEIGEKLNELDGKNAMLQAASLLSKKLPHCARNLEMVWDGIGTWRG